MNRFPEKVAEEAKVKSYHRKPPEENQSYKIR